MWVVQLIDQVVSGCRLWVVQLIDQGLCGCRLYMLEAQCRAWSGLTSVAIYWPLFFFDPTNTDKLSTAIAETKAFHKRMEAEGEPSLRSNPRVSPGRA